MKKLSFFGLALAMGSLFAAEINVDGSFNNFKRSWTVSTKRIGTVELVRENGINVVQIASENSKKGQIGIYTSRGFAAKKGDKITITADVKGGPVIISIIEYGKKKFLANQEVRFKLAENQQTHKVELVVENPNTDLVRVSFKVLQGAVVSVSNVKVDLTAAGENSK